jgi:uncharacterized protein (DUF1697 family)
MADLRDLARKVGLVEAQTLLQSGNLVFRDPGRTGAQLERLLGVQMEKRLQMQVDFFVRTVGEWRDVVARNPFAAEAEHDPSHLLVVFLRTPPDPAALKGLQAAITGPEIVDVHGRQAYVVYPEGMGRSRLSPGLIERNLGRGTGRNWNTVLKLAALVGA